MGQTEQVPASAAAGRYRVVAPIAKGGMGRVDLAVREEGAFRRLYAVKRLRDAYREDTYVREMFLEEARIAGLLHHPNVVPVTDVGEDEEGPYLVMDFVSGLPLSKVMRRFDQAGRRIPLQVTLRIVRAVADGLHAAHELVSHDGTPVRLVHRDVSPQNVLVGFDGGVRVTDFGIAKALGRGLETSTGVIKGKMAYMSPEQLKFETPDRRSDLFSFGVVLHEMLTGRRLYHSRDTNESARRILREPPPDLAAERSDLPDALVRLGGALLAKDPGERPPDARSVVQQLDEVLAELVVRERTVDLAEWIDTELGELRDEQSSKMRRVVEQAGDGSAPIPPARETSSIRARGRRGTSRRRLLVVAVGVLALGGGLAGLWLWSSGGSEPARGSERGDAPSPAVTAPEQPAQDEADDPARQTPAAGSTAEAEPPGDEADSRAEGEETGEPERARARERAEQARQRQRQRRGAAERSDEQTGKSTKPPDDELMGWEP